MVTEDAHQRLFKPDVAALLEKEISRAGYVPKPIDVEGLLAEVNRLLLNTQQCSKKGDAP